LKTGSYKPISIFRRSTALSAGTVHLIETLAYFETFYFLGAERQKRNEMLHELRKFDETGIITAQLSSILNQLPLSSLFSMKPSTPIATRDDIICLGCSTVVDVLTEYIETHSPQELLNLLSELCIQVVNYSTEVCQGVIGLNLVSEIP
jgi:hypothetical protein